MLIGKSFKITDPDARIRDDNFVALKNADGTFRLIPSGTVVTVEAFHLRKAGTDSDKEIIDFVKVRNFGWTAIANFETGLQNEALDEVAPLFISTDAAHKTITDPKSLVRTKNGNRYPAQNRLIPLGELVVVKKWSPDKKYAQVAFTHRDAGAPLEDSGRSPVWTASTNFRDGWFDIYGMNSRWEGGLFVDRPVFQRLIARDSEIEYLTKDLFNKYSILFTAALEAGIKLQLTSGFRSYRAQEKLHNLFINHLGEKAAVPGFSNHQNGIALDLNTGKQPEGPIYDWLRLNAPKFGFIRTVNGEPWHWEYDPANVKKFGFKLPRVIV